jgi:hypothetical protein
MVTIVCKSRGGRCCLAVGPYRRDGLQFYVFIFARCLLEESATTVEMRYASDAPWALRARLPSTYPIGCPLFQVDGMTPPDYVVVALNDLAASYDGEPLLYPVFELLRSLVSELETPAGISDGDTHAFCDIEEQLLAAEIDSTSPLSRQVFGSLFVAWFTLPGR